MQYILYNTGTQQILKTLNGPYTIDGQPAVLPTDIVQLSVVQDAPPAVTGAYTVNRVQQIDLSSGIMRNSWQVVPITDVARLKQYKINDLQTQYNNILSSGINPTGKPYILPSTDSDRNSFTQLTALLREYEDTLPSGSESTFNASIVTITDITGSAWQIPVSGFRQDMISYGSQINQLWGTFASLKSQVLTASGADAISAINWV